MGSKSPWSWRARTAWRLERRVGRYRAGFQAPALPAGCRVYAIGDVHGRLDLMQHLLVAVEADRAARPPAHNYVIQLGDFIDRGPHSARLIAGFHRLATSRPHFIALKGNHEATLSAVLNGDYDALRLWLEHGGRAALDSLKIDPALAEPDHMRELITALEAAIPAAQRQWLERLPVSVQIGDYYFVHAGIRPGVTLRRQIEHDQLWIRDEFLESTEDHGAVIVHGHTVEAHGPVLRHNRIGVDTGAYRTGRLVALGLEGEDRWVVDA